MDIQKEKTAKLWLSKFMEVSHHSYKCVLRWSMLNTRISCVDAHHSSPPLKAYKDCSEAVSWETFSIRSSAAALVLTDFMRCKVSYYPSNPSAAIPEAEKFSQNPKEKYLYMDFYDLKSALAIDLSPLLAEKCWLWRWCCQIPHRMVRLCATPTNRSKMKWRWTQT